MWYDTVVACMKWLKKTTKPGRHFPAMNICTSESLLQRNPPLNTLFSFTLSVNSPFRVEDQVSHPGKTTDAIMVKSLRFQTADERANSLASRVQCCSFGGCISCLVLWLCAAVWWQWGETVQTVAPSRELAQMWSNEELIVQVHGN